MTNRGRSSPFSSIHTVSTRTLIPFGASKSPSTRYLVPKGVTTASVTSLLTATAKRASFRRTRFLSLKPNALKNLAFALRLRQKIASKLPLRNNGFQTPWKSHSQQSPALRSIRHDAQPQRGAQPREVRASAGVFCWAICADQGLIFSSNGPRVRSATSVS